MNKQTCDLTVLILESNATASNLTNYVSKIHSTLQQLSIRFEILLVKVTTEKHTPEVNPNDQYMQVFAPGADYGELIQAGFQQAKGNYIIVLETDLLDPSTLLNDLWAARQKSDVVIASRYIPNGQADMPMLRKVLSLVLNLVFSRGLDLPVHDFSSGFRLYNANVIKSLSTESKGFDVLQEILVKVSMHGYQIQEIPFSYQSSDPAHKRMSKFGLAYIKTFSRLWKLRNSIASADYDARAYNAMMPPQRYWQRQRYKHITEMLKNKGACLDIGCGSSRIIGALPQGSVALDILLRKLRYARRYRRANVQGSIFDLPIPSESFSCVLCSQVIEHVPHANVLDELDRVLQPGGYLILGTPDYAKWQWNVIEWLYKVLLPQAYADEHITHYTFQELYGEFVTKRGYKLETTRYILQGELILGLWKPDHH